MLRHGFSLFCCSISINTCTEINCICRTFPHVFTSDVARGCKPANSQLIKCSLMIWLYSCIVFFFFACLFKFYIFKRRKIIPWLKCCICLRKENLFLLFFGRTERVDSEVHQTSHGQDTDEEAGEFCLSAICCSLLFLKRCRKKILLSDAPTPHGTPSCLESQRWLIDLGPNAQML